jgi:geranylgeranyl pyrophosphate synthase
VTASVAPETVAIVEAAGPHVPPLLERIEERLAQVAGAHGARLAEHATATISAGGKRLRPLLVLVAAGGVPEDGGASLVCAGAAVELVHSATLVHDDVLDRAALRRGRPTVVAVAGRAAATATGDVLFAAAFRELAAAGDPVQVLALSRAGSALAAGELLQREDAWNARVSVERYLHRCELKTARLFEAACLLGVRQAGGSDALARALEGFGRRVGLAFQLLDDVLDVSGPAARTGKHRGTDLLDGTVTLPFILARERDPGLAALDLRAQVITPEAAEEVCERIAATGALDEVRERALGLVREAKGGLPDGLPAGQRRALDLVADGVVARYA